MAVPVSAQIPMEWIIAAWRWFRSLMRPRVEFGAPQQRLNTPENSAASWWHVPVLVKPAWLTRSKRIERATVRLLRVEGGAGGREGIAMRWYSRDRDDGISEQTIEPGRVYLVPVVWRDESDDRRAFITNENWMLDKPNKRKWPLEEGRHNYWIEIWSGAQKWRGTKYYRISVPNVSSNGRFTMHVHYGEIY